MHDEGNWESVGNLPDIMLDDEPEIRSPLPQSTHSVRQLLTAHTPGYAGQAGARYREKRPKIRSLVNSKHRCDAERRC